MSTLDELEDRVLDGLAAGDHPYAIWWPAAGVLRYHGRELVHRRLQEHDPTASGLAGALRRGLEDLAEATGQARGEAACRVQGLLLAGAEIVPPPLLDWVKEALDHAVLDPAAVIAIENWADAYGLAVGDPAISPTIDTPLTPALAELAAVAPPAPLRIGLLPVRTVDSLRQAWDSLSAQAAADDTPSPALIAAVSCEPTPVEALGGRRIGRRLDDEWRVHLVIDDPPAIAGASLGPVPMGAIRTGTYRIPLAPMPIQVRQRLMAAPIRVETDQNIWEIVIDGLAE